MAPNLYVLILLFLLLDLSFITAKTDISNNIDDRIDSTIELENSLVARLELLEQQTAMLTQKCAQLEKHNQKLEQLLVEDTTTLSKLVLKGDSQGDALALIENILMAAIPSELQQVHASSVTKLPPDGNTRGSFKSETLKEFLGNREAELAAVLSPEYSTGVVNETDGDTVDLQYIGKALNLLDYTNQKLTSKIERLERQVQTDVTSSDKREIQMLQQLMERIEDIEDALVPTDDVITRDKIKAESRKSAFSVAATRPQVGKYGVITPLLLDHVFLNKGGDFNVTNSTFICEVPGYYYFTYTMRTYDGLYLAVSLVKNHEFIVALYSDPDDRNVMDSQSVMLELVPGDLIYLALGPSDQYAFYSDKNKLSTFSGFLLYKKS